MKSAAILTLTAVAALVLGGCASFRNAAPGDPLEPINRGIFSFNSTFDHYLFKPIAKGYDAAVPNPVKKGVSNVFQNASDAQSIVSDALQLKGAKMGDDLGRVMINTTFGLGGIFDLATPMGIERGNEDLGQTLGYWGIGAGPYVVIPFLGPSSARDLVGRYGDGKIDPVALVSSVPVRNSLMGARVVDTRVSLFPAEALMNQAALDRYTFMRSAYLQRRQSLVLDGKRPKEE
ncbi:MAG TPA: VacJ family lipoprotein [Casimicrobium huifangae]|jgi:phospholipid-binding lipoprotein MlaA|nr:VacJ family lipoprotein [Casimicrobium huifangae]HQD64170.1 VacJ family lipoprotein [Casimicrobium huifangae]